MSDDWKPIKETDFYDPHAAEKDATVRIAGSELERLKAERDAYAKAKAENDERFQLEIGELKAEVERLKTDTTHSCHDDCQRTACVLRREVERLKVLNAELKSGAICHICYDTMDEESKTMEQLRAENERFEAAHDWNVEQINRLSVDLTKEREITAMLRETLQGLGEYAVNIEKIHPDECAHGAGYSLLGQLAQQVSNEWQWALQREAEMRGENV